MQFSAILLAAASLALAQAKIAFTTLPDSVQAGKPVTLKWSGAEDGPVSIILRKGDSNNLQTVAVLTSSATGSSYTWTPSKDLSNADDYALQISQGVDNDNYTGQFSLSGGSTKAAASSYPTSSAASSSATLSASTTKLTTVTAVNTTSTSHTITLVGTAPASASGTGVSIHRNTTFSSATPTRSHSGGLVASTTGASASSTDDSSSSSTSAPSSSSTGNAASHMEVQIGAGLAAVFALFALL